MHALFPKAFKCSRGIRVFTIFSYLWDFNPSRSEQEQEGAEVEAHIEVGGYPERLNVFLRGLRTGPGKTGELFRHPRPHPHPQTYFPKQDQKNVEPHKRLHKHHARVTAVQLIVLFASHNPQ